MPTETLLNCDVFSIPNDTIKIIFWEDKLHLKEHFCTWSRNWETSPWLILCQEARQNTCTPPSSLDTSTQIIYWLWDEVVLLLSAPHSQDMSGEKVHSRAGSINCLFLQEKKWGPRRQWLLHQSPGHKENHKQIMIPSWIPLCQEKRMLAFPTSKASTPHTSSPVLAHWEVPFQILTALQNPSFQHQLRRVVLTDPTCWISVCKGGHY